MSKMTAVLAMCVWATACNLPARQENASDPQVGDSFKGGKILSVRKIEESSPAVGRYTFYMEPTSPSSFGGGYLLDTTNGDMWLITYAMENGKIGSRKLTPIPRTPQPEKTN